MKDRLQLDRSRLLGFKLSGERNEEESAESFDLRIGAKVGKPPPPTERVRERSKD